MIRYFTLLASFIALTVIPADTANASETITRFEAQASQSGDLVIASVTDLAFMRPLIFAFQQANPGVSVTYIEDTSNSLDASVSSACMGRTFLADLVISSSIAQQVRLVNGGCAREIESSALPSLPDWAQWRGELIGLTYEAAVMVYNKAAFADNGPPRSRFDLIDLMRQSGSLNGRIATYDIEESGVGYLFAFQDSTEASTWGRLIEGFGRNSVATFCCSSDVIDRVADGRAHIGYNVLGSYALSRAENDDRIGVILPNDYTLVLARAGYIPREARNVAAARAFLELALSPQGRAILDGETRLLTPLSGPDALARLSGDDEAAFRPIPLTPALLVSLDQAKRVRFLSQWRKSVTPPMP
ncbi:MAG: ABC transporter substrate-binding protein [Hoeflea sp.]|uniref:ABC transporter substrate-binding protein n=1 Tax=Hoeflea sp. TaxID=1940281 RepID=UPI001E1655B5|nr:ABC transporter substrate-binding protein [Hoeflea sp.]MBU4527361.1 ABC transporter substrate-binding protein [Alphaproteobacteria bacterium]MBU4546856.1 ABC transporter substrate-binding protein [Alphaproteobacteria bacterium]MBU4551632.1 ABC transporter substrate-binding protein [Alphaproteobacteria bacterium]MBV1725637.1 ABC transporter substrate-binding protein [Hoeflea sp.]MBV1759685.1 ABC transporter substrate-binding protein [Hoeflea sp.]